MRAKDVELAPAMFTLIVTTRSLLRVSGRPANGSGSSRALWAPPGTPGKRQVLFCDASRTATSNVPSSSEAYTL